MESLLFLEPMYGFSAEQKHIAVSVNAEDKLKEMAARLVGTADLIAIYIPEGTDNVYQVGSQKGRVVGAVKLLPMPSGKSIYDYYFDDLITQKRRWPIGWPCKAVFVPPDDQAPVLRTLVELLFGPDNFQAYVGRLQYGPIVLERRMAKALYEKLEPHRIQRVCAGQR